MVYRWLNRITDPESLLKLLIKVALVAVIVVVSLSSYSFYKVFSGFVIKSAEVDSIHLCQILISDQRDYIFETVPGKPVEIGLHGTDLVPFDNRLRHFLKPFNIIKVKIYNSERRIVYATDPTLIGRVDQANVRLGNALAGNSDAKMVTKEHARDLADEPLLDVDVVETYVPILSSDKRVVGSFEVYMNMTGYRDQIRQGVVLATLFMALALSGAFTVAYLLIKRAAGHLEEIQEQLELVAITDALTGVYNRGHIIVRGEEEFDRVRRSSRPLGCIMLDLDYFKRVNDTWGHAAGDQVLKDVAACLITMVRRYDLVGRYGGEEFIVLLPDVDFDELVRVAERMCDVVRENSFVVNGAVIPVTISLGVASCTKADRTLNDLIKRADEGLYKAKSDGRNRVSWIYQPGAGDLPAWH